jgi:hypothetical protein
MSSGSFRLAEMHWTIEPISVYFHSFFSYFSAILETWLVIVEALPRLLVPNPTQLQRAAISGGLVYEHICLKLEKTEENLFSKIGSKWQGTCTILFYP